jgi:hypothetical protein
MFPAGVNGVMNRYTKLIRPDFFIDVLIKLFCHIERETSGLMMELALQLNRGLCANPAELVGQWNMTAKNLGTRHIGHIHPTTIIRMVNQVPPPWVI